MPAIHIPPFWKRSHDDIRAQSGDSHSASGSCVGRIERRPQYRKTTIFRADPQTRDRSDRRCSRSQRLDEASGAGARRSSPQRSLPDSVRAGASVCAAAACRTWRRTLTTPDVRREYVPGLADSFNTPSAGFPAKRMWFGRPGHAKLDSYAIVRIVRVSAVGVRRRALGLAGGTPYSFRNRDPIVDFRVQLARGLLASVGQDCAQRSAPPNTPESSGP